MNQLGKCAPADRREFGRRTTCWHAWIIAPNRPKIACLMRNVSPTGARLELEVPSWLPWNFRLVVDAYKLEFECEVKYRKPGIIGVFFVVASDEWRQQSQNLTLEGLRDWKPGGGLPSHKPVTSR
ncbi:MAG: PilZ domain-containing protein [Hyphomicrobiaceae bacterium]|nr:MAG: PilZ domain-containing protein [Hyphomicrobiaceae bacterium]